MAAGLVGGGEGTEVCGCITSGGTESILTVRTQWILCSLCTRCCFVFARATLLQPVSSALIDC